MSTLAKRGWLVIAIGVMAASAAIAAGTGPFAIEVFGNFKRMAHSGDASGVVELDKLSGKAASYGVGALAGLRGEVLLLDGRILVSRGQDEEGRTEPGLRTDEAALMVVASVVRWEGIDIPTDMTQAQVEAFTLKEAARRGLDGSTPFPFVIKGSFSRVLWHVVTGSAGAHGVRGQGAHSKGHAQNRVFDQPDVAGLALGFHSGNALEGVITHPGERFHLHIVDQTLTRSGHVDAYAVRRGSTLMLPSK